MISKQQAKYFAYELTKLNRDDFTRVLMDATVDLQPHQIDAAAFALRSPLSSGVLLADEVGLGKTIEAGIVLAQLWAENKRHILIICPASLREQWHNELKDKFDIPSIIIDRKNYKKRILDLTDKIIIMSYNFAAKIERDLQPIPWNLVVMDEAHKLRNSYKESNKMGNALKAALSGRKKLLLTATPLQNSLAELFGLSQLIDEYIFGSYKSFKNQYTSGVKGAEEELKERLKVFCKRTLRKQVLEYIKYTERKAATFLFTPSNAEICLEEKVKAFLLEDSKYALPIRQRQLIEMILFKLSASSTAAIRGTFETILARLEKIKSGVDTSGEDSELINVIEDEYEDLENEDAEGVEEKVDEVELEKEIQQVKDIITLCAAVKEDEKAKTLVNALSTTFDKIMHSDVDNPPLKKALIFTESRRTQDFLFDYLSAHGYKDKIVLFNGSNKENREVLLDKFKNDAEIMIATEAGAEGLNMQFCSIVVNYDLPWNPQRVEQRIGRCHRYGQQHDVVVINFVNKSNKADQRIFSLLNEKFHLFEGVFGASDQVLGAIEDGLDIEKKILKICKTCRTTEEIDAAFNDLQKQMEDSINQKLAETKAKILDLLDTDVIRRMKGNLAQTEQKLTEYEQMFWEICQFILKDDGYFDNIDYSFTLTNPQLGIPQKYYFIVSGNKQSDKDSALLLRSTHPIAQYVLNKAKQLKIPTEELCFDVTNNVTKEFLLTDMCKKGISGFCNCQLLSLDSLDKEEYLVLSGIDNDFNEVPSEILEKLFRLKVISDVACPDIEGRAKDCLNAIKGNNIEVKRVESNRKNAEFVKEEVDKIDRYIKDKVFPLEKEIKDIEAQIKVYTKDSLLEPDPARILFLQEETQKLERQKKTKSRELYDLQDELDEQRSKLINDLRKKLSMVVGVQDLFEFKWRLV